MILLEIKSTASAHLTKWLAFNDMRIFISGEQSHKSFQSNGMPISYFYYYYYPCQLNKYYFRPTSSMLFGMD